MVSRCTYDAFLCYLVDRDAGHTIDWDAPVIQKYKQDENSSKEGEGLDFRFEKHRKNFIRRASRYEVLYVNGNKFLSKLEKGEQTDADGKSVFIKKRVICDDEYESLLREHHDKKNHVGFIKCYYEVSTLHFIKSCQVHDVWL